MLPTFGTLLWYPKERADLKKIHDGNSVLTDDKFVIVRGFLKLSKYSCLCIRNEHPCEFNNLDYV